MRDIEHTIAEYERSSRRLRARIDQLSDRISGRVPLPPDESTKALEKRRYLLYTELADMENIIFWLKDYLLAAYPDEEQVHSPATEQETA